MLLVSVRVFHVTKDHCHVCYTTSASKMAAMVSNKDYHVETILVVCPDGYSEDNLVAFHQVEFYDDRKHEYEYVNVATGRQVYHELQSAEQRVGLEDVVIYHHQVVV
jgi:hypothetical protein